MLVKKDWLYHALLIFAFHHSVFAEKTGINRSIEIKRFCLIVIKINVKDVKG